MKINILEKMSLSASNGDVWGDFTAFNWFQNT